MAKTLSASLQVRARAEIERRRRIESGAHRGLPELYAFDPAAYIRDRLGWIPWSGTGPGAPGQIEILEAYTLAIRQQLERNAFEQGTLTENDLIYWRPDQLIQNRIRLEAGHTVGKTKVLGGLVNHFFDCFVPSIIYTFAPTWEQIHDLLWKEIKSDREGKGLPGRILDLALDRGANHFAKGRATNNAGGKGTERAQGQHGPYLMFVIDEAEGNADFVYDAIESMSSGGVVIVLMAANPRTRTSRFHKERARSDVHSFRMSCIHHPNVLAGREVVPNAVRREYVERMVEQHCEVVTHHSEDDHTFTLPFPVRTTLRVHPPGTIFLPDAEFLFRVLGIAPANIADNVLVPVGRYESATLRKEPASGSSARIGVDVARYGKDAGTIWIRHGMRIWRWAIIRKQDYNAYAGSVKEAAVALHQAKVSSLHVRIDAGGGFGGGVNDIIKNDPDLKRRFADYRTYEVDFGGTPSRHDAFADMATEMMAEAAETLKGVAIVDPPNELAQDLTERTYRWVNIRGVAVKRLEPKDDFRDRIGRSPDDGDGFVLAAAPDFLFKARPRLEELSSMSYVTP